MVLARAKQLPINAPFVIGCSSILQQCSHMSSKAGGGSGSKKKPSSLFSPKQRRRPGKSYESRHQPKPLKKILPPKGPREPLDISYRMPKIDLSKIKVTDVDESDGNGDDLDDWSHFGPEMQTAIQKLRHGGTDLDVETHLKMMDYLTSATGSTEDLVGERRALSLESWDGKPTQAVLDEINAVVEKTRLDYLELPPSDLPTEEELEAASTMGARKVPFNQLAHGPW